MAADSGEVETVLRATPVFRRLAPQDLKTIAQAATIKTYDKGQVIFEQDTASDAFYTVASGRVKIFKRLASGKDVILEVFGTGDPLGAVAARPDDPARGADQPPRRPGRSAHRGTIRADVSQARG